MWFWFPVAPPGLTPANLETKVESVPGADLMMVALYPPPAVATALAEYGSEPANELHISLVILDVTNAPTEAIGALRGAVAAVAQSNPKLEVRLGGVGRFHNPGGEDVLWSAVDSPGLVELRQALVAALAAAGWPILTDHGFSPHLTLSYIPSDEPSTVEMPENTGWVQSDLTLAAKDGTASDFPLLGGGIPDPPDSPAEVIPSSTGPLLSLIGQQGGS